MVAPTVAGHKSLAVMEGSNILEAFALSFRPEMIQENS